MRKIINGKREFLVLDSIKNRDIANTEDLLLLNSTSGDVVIAHGWDEESGNWAQGNYYTNSFAALMAAMEKFEKMANPCEIDSLYHRINIKTELLLNDEQYHELNDSYRNVQVHTGSIDSLEEYVNKVLAPHGINNFILNNSKNIEEQIETELDKTQGKDIDIEPDDEAIILENYDTEFESQSMVAKLTEEEKNMIFEELLHDRCKSTIKQYFEAMSEYDGEGFPSEEHIMRMVDKMCNLFSNEGLYKSQEEIDYIDSINGNISSKQVNIKPEKNENSTNVIDELEL